MMVNGQPVSPWVLGGLIGTMLWTQVVMVWLKQRYPDWQSKAWAPPLIGSVTTLLGAMAAGQVVDFASFQTWVMAGIGVGATASSVRDHFKGK